MELDSVQRNSEARQAELESLVDQLGTEKANLLAEVEAKDQVGSVLFCMVSS